MAAKRVGSGKASAASPVVIVLQLPPTDKLLLARVETLVALAVVLTRKCLAAVAADKRSLVSVSPEMRAKVVGACEALGAEAALECGRVLLSTLGGASGGVVRVVGGWAIGICEVEDVVPVGNGGYGGGAAALVVGGRRAGLADTGRMWGEGVAAARGVRGGTASHCKWLALESG
jgi:hypothetical protein